MKIIFFHMPPLVFIKYTTIKGIIVKKIIFYNNSLLFFCSEKLLSLLIINFEKQLVITIIITYIIITYIIITKNVMNCYFHCNFHSLFFSMLLQIKHLKFIFLNILFWY